MPICDQSRGDDEDELPPGYRGGILSVPGVPANAPAGWLEAVEEWYRRRKKLPAIIFDDSAEDEDGGASA